MAVALSKNTADVIYAANRSAVDLLAAVKVVARRARNTAHVATVRPNVTVVIHITFRVRVAIGIAAENAAGVIARRVVRNVAEVIIQSDVTFSVSFNASRISRRRATRYTAHVRNRISAVRDNIDRAARGDSCRGARTRSVPTVFAVRNLAAIVRGIYGSARIAARNTADIRSPRYSRSKRYVANVIAIGKLNAG